MKNTLILILTLATTNLFAICSSPIARTNNTPNTPLTTTKYNTDLNTVYTKVNSLPGDCINDATITTAKIADASITAAKLAATVLANVIPAGIIMPYAGTTAPTGFFLCDGSQVSRITYAALYAVIGNSFGSGNGSSTFHLPDMQGRFLRGKANGSANDPDRLSRAAMATGGNAGDNVGSVQADTIQNITAFLHVSDVGVSRANETFSGAFYPYGSSTYGRDFSSSIGGAGLGFDASRVVRASTETRPKNVSVNYIIKY